MKERTSVSYRKVNRAAAVVIDSVVVIPRTQSALVVSTILGSFLVALAVRFTFQCYHTYNVTHTLLATASAAPMLLVELSCLLTVSSSR